MTKVGAVWARISTPEQASLESQIERARAKLESAGYIVSPERILATDWTSLDLFSCPEFQRLRGWIQRKEIQGLGILDRDRLEADGLQRLEFLADCRDAGIELLICQGPPILDEEEGLLVELALTIGKKRSVLRAKQGSKDGLHDRAVKYRLPTSHHKVCGYEWVGKTPEELKLSRRLEPNEDWPIVKLIFDMALEGKTYDPIIKELKKRAMLSPDGMDEWVKATISSILHNPIYAGRYYALKKEAVQPIARRAKTYGNSSCRKLPLEQAEYLPEIEVVNPPITWEERGQILHQLEVHQKLAKRNGRADYLLRGFIFCETHRGKKGEPRRYHGRPHYDSWCYVCPIGGCDYPFLKGPEIEELAKLYTDMVVNCQPDEFYERISNQQNRDELEQSLQRELHTLEAKYNRNINAETELENRNLLGQEHPEVYRRLKARFQDERIWIEERKQALSEELTQLDCQAEAVASLEQIQAKVRGRIDELTKAEWRELFMALNLEIHVRTEDDPEVWPNDWLKNRPMCSMASKVEVYFGVPIEAQQVGSIVLTAPGSDSWLPVARQTSGQRHWGRLPVRQASFAVPQ